MIILIVGVVGAILGWGVFRLLEAIVRHALDQNKSWVLLADGDPAHGKLLHVRLRGNELSFKPRKGQEGRTYSIDGRGRLATDRGDVYLIHRRHGWTMAMPNDATTVNQSPKLRHLAAFNPETYYLLRQRNLAASAMNANQEGDHWIVKLAPFAFAALLMVTVLVMFLAWRIMRAGVGA